MYNYLSEIDFEPNTTLSKIINVQTTRINELIANNNELNNNLMKLENELNTTISIINDLQSRISYLETKKK